MNKIYIVSETGIEDYGAPNEINNYVLKTKEEAQNTFLSCIERFYGKDIFNTIRKNYSEAFDEMFENGRFEQGFEEWSLEFDSKAYNDADFKLEVCILQEFSI